jgi:hypothetical protein
MHSFYSTLFSAVLAIGITSQSVLAATADPLQVAVVKQQFINAHIVPDVIPSFNPVGLLKIAFPSGEAPVGGIVTKDNSGPQPQLNTVFNANDTAAKYTVMMVDGNYVGSTNPTGLNLHWLLNNAAIATNGTVDGSAGTPTIPFAGPGPAAGSGPHRYTILVFQQPANFKIPDAPKANSGVHPINVAQYLTSAGLTTPLFGSYFTVEVGTATVTVGTTTAVNPSTISLSSTPSGSSSNSASKTSSSTSTATTGAAVKIGAGSLGSSLLALAGIVALAA